MKKMVGLFVLSVFVASPLWAKNLSLDEAKGKVVNENINVSIAYEQYIQAKNTSRAKTLQLLPSISVDMLIYDYQYALLRSVIPEPQKFFEASASKDLALAASVNRKIVQKNLLEDLETTLYLNQYHTELLASFEYELKTLEDISTRSQEAYDLGAIDFTEYYRNQRNVVSSRTQLVNSKEVIENQNYTLKLILQEKNTEELTFDALAFDNSEIAFPTDVTEAMDLAVRNSHEIAQYNHLRNAASKQKKGAAISWLSWGGVGFDYFSKVSIAKSEVRKIDLLKEKSAIEVKNQVANQYSQITSQQRKIALQSELLNMAEVEYGEAQEAETDLLNSYINTRKAELSLIYAQRDALRLKYDLEIKYIKLKRLVGVNMITNELPR